MRKVCSLPGSEGLTRIRGTVSELVSVIINALFN